MEEREREFLKSLVKKYGFGLVLNALNSAALEVGAGPRRPRSGYVNFTPCPYDIDWLFILVTRREVLIDLGDFTAFMRLDRA